MRTKANAHLMPWLKHILAELRHLRSYNEKNTVENQLKLLMYAKRPATTSLAKRQQAH